MERGAARRHRYGPLTTRIIGQDETADGPKAIGGS